MKIRKLWTVVLVAMAIVAVLLNTLFLNILTLNYYHNFLNTENNSKMETIQENLSLYYDNDEFQTLAIKQYLWTTISSPMVQIRVLNLDGVAVATVSRGEGNQGAQSNNDNNSTNQTTANVNNPTGTGSQNKKGTGYGVGKFKDLEDNTQQSKDYSSSNYETIDKVVSVDGKKVGTVEFVILSSINNSWVAQEFQSSLLLNSLLSIAVVTILALLIGLFIGKKISRSLRETKNLAVAIQTGDMNIDEMKRTFIVEVNDIRNSLGELDRRLKLRGRARKTMIDELVHQVRTPLAVLQSHVEALEDGLLEPTGQEFALWKDQITNITLIISNMAQMIDSGYQQVELKQETVNVEELVRNIMGGLQFRFDHKTIAFRLISSEKLKEIITDPYLLSQSIYNLVTNSYKYTPVGGEVEISIEQEDEKTKIRVTDTGIGIRKNHINQIFQAYYREGLSKEQGEGLGLYIAKENVEQLGGKLTVESKEGVGSTFTIILIGASL